LSNDGFWDASGQGVDVQNWVDFRPLGFRPSGFAPMQAAALGALEGGGDAPANRWPQ